MTIDLECKKRIVKWIKDNPGYVYSQFTFVPKDEEEVLPIEEDFEKLTYDFDSWKQQIDTELTSDEMEKYPGAIRRLKYVFSPLGDNLYAHLFLDGNDFVLYVVVGT